MPMNLEDYTYSKQYILVESKDKKIAKSLYDNSELENIDDYLFSVVTSVTQKTVDGVKKHLIQYEDKELGWIEINDSIQIFRFKPMNYLVVESNFQTNDLNKEMEIDKDFISHFKGKLLTIKSEIQYKGERYYSVFLKNKFHGFHHESHLDPLFEVNVPITPENLKRNELYILSNLSKPVTEIPEFENGKILSIFRKNNIGKIQLDKNVYWVDLTLLSEITIPSPELENKNIEQLKYEDLMYSVDQQKTKAKEMLKTIISAKDYINNTDVAKHLKFSAKKNSKDDAEELREELNSFKSENLELKRQLRKESNDLKLSEKRLDHQIDYKNRLEAQRDKYKSRMHVVEEKLAGLNAKYQELKKKKTGKTKKFF